MLALATTYVPFAYSVQARYLVFHPIELGPFATIAIILVNALGYYIFRVANREKDDFRNGKNPKSTLNVIVLSTTSSNKSLDLKFMTTKKGSKLLTSGWWGRSRHPNYM